MFNTEDTEGTEEGEETVATEFQLLAVNALSLAVANAKAGVHETGVNHGDEVEFWQKTVSIPAGSSWCAAFVYAMLLKAYCEMHGLLIGATAHDNRVIMLDWAGVFSHETGIPRTGYCPTVAAVALKAKRFHGKSYNPVAGDLVLYDFNDQGEPHHIGFVAGLNKNNTLRTVEGNTSAGGFGSQANGDGVYQKVRSRGAVFGFVHFG